MKQEDVASLQQTIENLGESIKQQHPADVAAAFFTLEQPRLKALLDQMSLRQMRRFVYNLVSHPFVPEEQQMKSEEERKAFYIADQMVTNRAIMMLHAEMEKAEEAMNKEQTESMNGSDNNSLEGIDDNKKEVLT